MLTHRIPYPPDRGDRIRSWNILRHLSERFEISLGCVSEEPLGGETQAALDMVCHQIAVAPIGRRSKWLRAAASAARGRSLTEGLFWSPALAAGIERWSTERPFDAVLVYCSSMLRYVRSQSLRQVPRLVDLVDVDSEKFYQYAADSSPFKRPLYRCEASRVRKLEHEAVRTARAVTLVSEAEADVLRESLPPGDYPIHGIANGVDTEYFAPAEPQAGAAGERDGGAEFPRLVFVGVLNYPPNVQAVEWFVQNVWPAVRERCAEAKFEIVGKHPAAELQRLGAIAGIHVVGPVPDVRPYLRQADIVIAPLQLARGIQNKVLEAMAMGRPVIASPAAAAGIDAVDGQHLAIADTPEQWQQAIDNLCRDPAHRTSLAQAARTRVSDRYTWPVTLKRFEQLLE